MSPEEDKETYPVERVPRASGDEPKGYTWFTDVSPCSPRERG